MLAIKMWLCDLFIRAAEDASETVPVFTVERIIGNMIVLTETLRPRSLRVLWAKRTLCKSRVLESSSAFTLGDFTLLLIASFIS